MFLGQYIYGISYVNSIHLFRGNRFKLEDVFTIVMSFYLNYTWMIIMLFYNIVYCHRDLYNLVDQFHLL